MDTYRKLGEVAANLDDMSDTVEDLKNTMEEGGAPSGETLDRLQEDMEEASDTIDEIVDPESPRKR